MEMKQKREHFQSQTVAGSVLKTAQDIKAELGKVSYYCSPDATKYILVENVICN